jgi:hypothetical protein
LSVFTIAWVYDLPKATLKDKASRLALETAENKFVLRDPHLTAMRNMMRAKAIVTPVLVQEPWTFLIKI